MQLRFEAYLVHNYTFGVEVVVGNFAASLRGHSLVSLQLLVKIFNEINRFSIVRGTIGRVET